MKVEPFDNPFGPHYEVRDGGITGRLIGETPILAEARLKIGKTITPPVPAKHGVKTNVPKSATSSKEGGKKKAA